MITLSVGGFDSAPHTRILYKLANMGITGTTLTWVKDFLTEHSFQVAVGASMSFVFVFVGDRKSWKIEE